MSISDRWYGKNIENYILEPKSLVVQICLKNSAMKLKHFNLYYI